MGGRTDGKFFQQWLAVSGKKSTEAIGNTITRSAVDKKKQRVCVVARQSLCIKATTVAMNIFLFRIIVHINLYLS